MLRGVVLLVVDAQYECDVLIFAGAEITTFSPARECFFASSALVKAAG